mmetsp:Transcript_51772/g.117800  ORF Transcript_51772/g.117800 Transcript_51772/m.117800 type:complete len:1239 (+) Transcript_51772:38-3754(+)
MQKGEVSPFDSRSLLTSITFGYGLPLMRLGAQRPLEAADLPPYGRADSAALVVDTVVREWKVEERKKNPNLWMALYRSFRGKFWWSAFWNLLESISRLVQPVLLRAFLDQLAKDDPNVDQMYLFAAGLVLSSFLQAVVHHQFYFVTMCGGWGIRMGLSGALHWKLLRLHAASLQGKASADCYNLIASDVMRFDGFIPAMHFIWGAALDFVVAAILLAFEVGVIETVCSLSVLVLVVAVMINFGRRFAQRRKITAGHSDARLKLTSEVVNAIMSVKVYCWEGSFQKRIQAIRGKEHDSIFQRQKMVAANSTMYFIIPAASSLVLFLIFVARGKTLTLATVYAALGLLSTLRVSFGKHLNRALQFGPECHAAVKRFTTFLTMPEVEARPELIHADPSVVLELKNASFAWPAGTAAVKSLTVQLKKGELLVVAGPVGCGKSALLQALLGELTATSGTSGMRGRVSYAPQSPWIQAGTLRTNVELGSESDPKWYEQVVHACSLDVDAVQLGPKRHETEIGEKGVNLSGGQRARVGLARAVYAKPDVILLDDPLAAVDPQVASHLVHKCIKAPVLANAGIVLCTHHDTVFPMADKMILLGADGAVRAVGTPAEVAAACGMTLANPTPLPAERPVVEAKDAEEGESKGLVQEEGRAKGSVGFRTYWRYVQGAGVGRSMVVLLLFLGSYGVSVTAQQWVGVWATAENQSEARYVIVFSVLTAVTMLMASVRSMAFYASSLRASSQIHAGALSSVLGAKLGFFSANPAGRILNRFSGDLSNVDEQLSQSMHEVLDLSCIALGGAVLVCAAVPPVIPGFLAIFWYMIRLRRFCVKSITELKRLDNLSKSPVFDTFASTLRGLECIRAFGRQEAAQLAMVSKLDANARAWFWWLIPNRFIGFRLDMQCVVIMVFAAFGGTLVRDLVAPELIGLAILQTILLSGLFQYMVRMSAMVESFMTSFERLLAYNTLEAEPTGGATQPPKGFPSAGAIAFRGVQMRYREDLPVILKGVTFSCPGGVKVGICGRTGSGKSSLFMALAHLAEVEGTMEIDGIGTTNIPLAAARRCISWVPQEPSFFTGSLRFNLDPFGDYSDEAIRGALGAVKMGQLVEALDMDVSEGGGNFSAGERQLLSLSRALLQRRKVLCMDEAFANVDFETDAKVQAAITTVMTEVGATVWVIAHRMKTLADSDYILVMNEGVVGEFGKPDELLSSGGLYSSMVKQARLDGEVPAADIEEHSVDSVQPHDC